ncbi:acetoacetate--CoA ligase [Leekyejoonella antrihumi]|uniref:Acetoacetate--CoA ligase n=1 Tax=Leekyejoonella antrihumi TaxID=1660198 RepID=A0A563DXR6_9MICO|nr:acetoacetate--CoA ligase [Leekyejoonella antrihumi]TWP34995.1 acetoacetate--CoA ligase [Leekyejoonella antrihumi]
MEHLAGPAPLWEPTDQTVAGARVTAFRHFAQHRTGRELPDYDALWTWSTTDLAEFWSAVWDYYGVGEMFGAYRKVLDDERMPGSRWFTEARVNFAEYALSKGAAAEVAIAGATESGGRIELTWAQLRAQVASVAQWYRDRGVGRGDRVVGYLPNIPEAIVAMLAAAAIGAIWSSVGQDYAPAAATDRFGPLEPRVLVTTDGYRYAGAELDRRQAITQVLAGLPTVTDALVIERLTDGHLDHPGVGHWADVVAQPAEPYFLRVGFDGPLWVLFSSGTTGLPKGMVQSHGGILLEQLKLLGLHADLGPQDRFFWFTSPSWVMWNIQLSGLLTGASVVCYDGSPTYPDARTLWRLVADLRVTSFGSSPGYLQASRDVGMRPAIDLDLSALRALWATGSPISPSTHAWAVESSGGLPLFSISGGTDICSAFCGGVPTRPIWPGELSVRNLGVAMDAWDPAGQPLRDIVGELVMTRPLPSMPVSFWNDPAGIRYHDSYFDAYPGVWRHGDWITVTDRGSVVIHGRSDATLNRHGVRMGSADIYHVVEDIDDVQESLVLGIEQPDGGYWMPLFVVPTSGSTLDDALRDRIRAAIRQKVSPRHVPDEIIQLAALPHTRTGKRLEVPLKRILQGASTGEVLQRTAVDDPDLLQPFLDLARARRTEASAAST